MAGYLFDTDALSFVLNGRLNRYPQYRLFLQQLPRAAQYTCAPVVGELHAGARRTADPTALLQRIGTLLARLNVVPFDRKAAEIYGRLRATLETSGQRVADMDLQNAACAIAHELILVTGNERHFSRMPDVHLWVIHADRIEEVISAYHADRAAAPTAAALPIAGKRARKKSRPTPD